MSEDPRDREEGRADEPGAGGNGGPGDDFPEEGGLGLTEEFARIEEEIERDAGPDGPEAEEPADPSDTVVQRPEGAGTDGPPPAGDSEPEAGGGAGDPQEGAGGADVSASAEEASAAEDGAGSGEDDAGGAEDPAAGEGVAEEDAASDGAAAGEPEPAKAEPPPAEQRTDFVPPARPKPARPRPVGERPQVRPMPPPLAISAPGEEEIEERSTNLWLRFLAGSVLIVTSVASAVAVAGLLFLSDVAAELRPIPGVKDQLEAVDPGDPQTILIIGSDRRDSDPKGLPARSDTAMLLRVDPGKDVLSLFSLPRDLKVEIPGVGVGKLNEAYSAGGEKKTLKTVKRFTGLEVNHVVVVNFQGFADAVNAIGCVYVDVDREYFNDNSGLAPSEQYSEIDINAGYQRLCGLKALQFVRFRHTDTDLVRAARQQDFLREARSRVPQRDLIPIIGGTGNELIDIFTKYTESDISDEADVIGILKSFIAVRDVPVNEVHFQGDIGGPDSTYVTSTSEQVQTAVDQFLNGVGSEGQRGGESAGEKKGGGKKKKKKQKAVAPEAEVVDADPQFAKYAGTIDRRLKIPAFYPTKLVPGSTFGRDSRTYEYRNDDDKKESAFKYVISRTNPSTIVEYYGVMGTSWESPPILDNPSETRKIDGREYLLFYDGDRLRMVGWREDGASYWLNNTLLQSIPEAEMLAMATSMKKVG